MLRDSAMAIRYSIPAEAIPVTPYVAGTRTPFE